MERAEGKRGRFGMGGGGRDVSGLVTLVALGAAGAIRIRAENARESQLRARRRAGSARSCTGVQTRQ